MTMVPAFIFGVDLGEVRDFSAVSAMRVRIDPVTRKPHYVLGLLERHNGANKEGLSRYAMPGRDFYELLGAHLLAQVDDPRLPYHKRSSLAVDGTGSGREAVKRFLRGRLSRVVPLFPLQIRREETRDGQRDSGFIQVSRKTLLTTLALVMDSGRFTAVEGLDLWRDFKNESTAARIKEPRGGDPTAGPRLTKHDDLAFSVGMGVWIIERISQQGVGGYVPVRYQ